MKTLFDWCIEKDRPDILQYYCDAVNPLSAQKIGFSSGKPVNWYCRTCGYHWKARPNKISRKRPNRPICPQCSREQPSSFYNAAFEYPELVLYWDTVRNADTLYDYTPGSNHPAHWCCSSGHTWARSIKEQVRAAKRLRNSSHKQTSLCPYCRNQRISAHYNLEALFGDIATQWCYRKNGALTPRQVLPYSNTKVYWQCPFNPKHIWEDKISNRTKLLRDCPTCAKHFHISYTSRAIYYYLYQNGIPCTCEVPIGRYRIDIEVRLKDQAPVALEIDGYRHQTPEAISRDARKDALLREKGYRVIRLKELPETNSILPAHNDIITYPVSTQYQYLNQIIEDISKKLTGVPIVSDHVQDHSAIEALYYHVLRERSLAVQYPSLAKEWSNRNPDTPDVVSTGTSIKRLWNCPICGKEYSATIANRVNNHSGCPYCAHLRVTPQTCLATVRPDIAAEWDYDKNAPLQPTDVLPGTEKRVWWKCKHNHSWQAMVYTRTGSKGTGCPYCSGHRILPETSLAAKTPALAHYWHPVKNDRTAEEIAPYSNKKVWWQCPQGHEWYRSVNQMQRCAVEKACPACRRMQNAKPILQIHSPFQ